MEKHERFGLLAAGVMALGLWSAGCVSAEQHRDALADLQRLRMEAWQRGVEASALRLALDRASAENVQLRAHGQVQAPAVTALASRLEEVARKQDAMLLELRSTPPCAPTPATPPPAGSAQAAQPQGRKVTDLLYSRF